MSKMTDLFINALTAPNPAENCTIKEARDFAGYLTALGLPTCEIVALQGTESGADDADVVSLADVERMGVAATVPLYLFMKAGTPDQKMLNVASERLRIKGVDGENAFADLWAERNQGRTREEAFAQVLNVPSMMPLAMGELARIKSEFHL